MTHRKTISIAVLGSFALALAGPAQAQRGGPPAGVGGGMGHGGGAGSMGGGFPGSGFPGQGSPNPHSPWTNGGLPGDSAFRAAPAHAPVSVLDRNERLDTALGKALTNSGVTLPAAGLRAACQGFGNLGQCVSALHVSHNLAIPGGFDALKTAMTSGDKLPLGKAIQQLAPAADAKAEARKANRQARSELDSLDDD